MCGIAGIFGAERERMEDILDLIAHRGPDDNSLVELDQWNGTLGHRRLSILDLDPRSNQPFYSIDQRYVLVFNGEIYNYLDLKAELDEHGQVFRTTSDTEVLLYWLVHRGKAGLARVEGMFAFAWMDLEKGQLLAVRDPIGEKPFYYTLNPDQQNFAFCSEIKGLLSLSYIDRSLNREALADYLRFLYTAPPHTLYNGIRELPPGHVLEVDLQTYTYSVEAYFDLEAFLSTGTMAHHDPVSGFRSTFDTSVAGRLQSDVPVCVYLSGGMDSNTILASALQQKPDESFHTFTIQYSGSKQAEQDDESSIALRAARFYEASNTLIKFELDRPFLEMVEHTVDMFDQPFGNATSLVSELLAEQVAKSYKVALVGDGGDEVQVGYPRHRAVLMYQKWKRLPEWIRRLLAAGVQHFPMQGRWTRLVNRARQFFQALDQPLAEAFLDWSSYLNQKDLEDAFGAPVETTFYRSLLKRFNRYADDPLKAAAVVDLTSFVPYNLMQCADRTSMQHSLELRSPFLAPPFIRFTQQLSLQQRFQKKAFKPLAKAAYQQAMPAFILEANQPFNKKAFNPPISDYVRRHFDILTDYLLGSEARLPHLLQRSFVERQISLFESKAKDNAQFLWGLASLECWLRKEEVELPGHSKQIEAVSG